MNNFEEYLIDVLLEAKSTRAQYRQNENKVGDFFRRLSRNIKQKRGEWTDARRERASNRAVRQAHKKAKQAEIDAMMAQTDMVQPDAIEQEAQRAQFNKSMGKNNE